MPRRRLRYFFKRALTASTSTETEAASAPDAERVIQGGTIIFPGADAVDAGEMSADDDGARWNNVRISSLSAFC